MTRKEFHRLQPIKSESQKVIFGYSDLEQLYVVRVFTDDIIQKPWTSFFDGGYYSEKPMNPNPFINATKESRWCYKSYRKALRKYEELKEIY